MGVSMRDTKINESPYAYSMKSQNPKIACHKSLTLNETQSFINLARHGYRYRLYLDDLPSATVVKSGQNTNNMVDDYSVGIPIGDFDPV